MKLDLKDVKGKADVEAKMEEFQKRADDVAGKEAYARVNDEIRRANKHIEDYQYELDHMYTNNMDMIQEIQAKNELKEAIKLAKERLAEFEKEKAELDKQRDSSESQKQKSQLMDDKGAFYTQAKMKFENDVRETKHEMEGILIEMGKATDGETMRALNERYASLQDKLSDLQSAIKLCDDQKAVLKAELEESIKGINEIISRKPEETKPEKSEDEGEKGKGEKGKDEKGEEEKGEEEKGEDGKGDDKKDEEKIADLIKEAEGILALVNVKAGMANEAHKEAVEKLEKVKAKHPTVIRGRLVYDALNIVEKFRAKRAAYMIENNIVEPSNVNLLQRARLFLPSNTYRNLAIDGIKKGAIPVSELGHEFEEEEITYQRPQQEKDLAFDVEVKAQELKNADTLVRNVKDAVAKMKEEKNPEKVAQMKAELEEKAKKAGIEVKQNKEQEQEQNQEHEEK